MNQEQRVKSLQWWRELRDQQRKDLVKKHISPFASHHFVDGVQIELMYTKEVEFMPKVDLNNYDLKAML
jgi:hypothetical protein